MEEMPLEEIDLVSLSMNDDAEHDLGLNNEPLFLYQKNIFELFAKSQTLYDILRRFRNNIKVEFLYGRFYIKYNGESGSYVVL